MTTIGLTCVFQNAFDALSDRECYERDMAIALQAEPLGYDKISIVEHHFNGYSIVP